MDGAAWGIDSSVATFSKVGTTMTMRTYALVLFMSAVIGAPFSGFAQTNSRTEAIEYHDDTALWVLGQVKKVTCTGSIPADPACNGGTGSVISQTDYGWKALPWRTYEFGKLTQTLSYETAVAGQVGTIRTVADGNGNVTTATNWKRGIPQSIRFPATPDSPSGAIKSAVVNDHGWILSVNDETNSKTCYGYDAMGRVARITYPSETQANTCDTSKWEETTINFSAGHPAAYGMPAGHWRQTTLTGNARKILILDALWRPVVEQVLDLGDVAATHSEVITRYDSSGRIAFRSYPMRTNGAATYSDTSLKGVHTEYDALDRVTRSRQGWEGTGQLTTTTEYLSGFRTRVTPPRGQGAGTTYQTITSYQAWDQPTYELPTSIAHPTGAYTHITRDPFGKPTILRRSNSSSSTGGTVAINRTYTYNTHQELCRSVEPETGATLMGYDGAGNLTWSASGLPTGTACHATGNATAINARKAVRTYDARNRLRTLSFPDGRGNQSWEYTPDGLPSTISTVQFSGGAPFVNAYNYNRRRMLVNESQTPVGGPTWTLMHHYNGNGHLADSTYPSGLTVAYAPNALGQPTRAGTFATGASYFPNGALKQFTYGNNITHTLTQNARGLPSTSCDFYGTCNGSAALRDEYHYDQHGNVLAILDGRTGNRGNREMTYDGLDRLTQAASPMFGTATYAYDVLDNLTRVKVTGGNQIRDHHYCYDANWWLTNIKTGSCNGATVIGLGYDVQGNLNNKSGQTYTFDFGNRLRRVGTGLSYTYDGHGRRVTETVGPTNPRTRRFMYGVNGQLFFEEISSSSMTDNIYLAGNLVARRTRPLGIPNPSDQISYQHTDALGSPVAVSNPSRVVSEQTEYEAYGHTANRMARNGIGYTGHVEDAATGLVYMQQRYYDPQIGLFLSVDPVTAYSNPVAGFNRYRYAANNPYKFIDPDGRTDREAAEFLRTFMEEHKSMTASLISFFLGASESDNIPNGSGQLQSSAFPGEMLIPTRAAPVAMSRLGQQAAPVAPQLGRKLDYFLGKATGNQKNIDRSRDMLRQLENVGLHDSPVTRQYLTEHLGKVLNDPTSVLRVQGNGRVVRESVLAGPDGVRKFETIWEGQRLITGTILGGR